MLTPLEVENVNFRRALSGYERGEVEQFLVRVSQALEEYIAQVEAQRLKVAALEDQLQRYRDSEELLKNSVVLAQRTADELIAAAHQRSDNIIRAAQLEGESVRQSLGELRAEREQFEYAFHGLLTGFLQRLEHGNPALLPSPPPVPAPAIPAALNQPAAFQHPVASATHPPAPPPAVVAPVIPPGPTHERDTDVHSFAAAVNAVQLQPETDAVLLPPSTVSTVAPAEAAGSAQVNLEESFAARTEQLAQPEDESS